MRVLFTSSDPGSALQNNSFKNYLQDYGHEVFVICQTPTQQFYDFGKPTDNYTVERLDKESKKLIRDYVNNFNPNFIMLGLSARKSSVDVIVNEFAIESNIPTGAIQDFWGYTGSFDAKLPQYFFVLDYLAKKVTKLNGFDEDRIFVTGSPKHFLYRNHIVEWKKENPFESKSIRNLVFFSQPLNIPGIIENFNVLCDCLKYISMPYNFYLKPHPLEKDIDKFSLNEKSSYIRLLPSRKNNEKILLHADIVFNCFSTIGYDHNWVQYFCEKPIGSLVYMNIGPRIKKSREDYINNQGFKLPFTEIGTTINRKDELINYFKSFSQEKIDKYVYFRKVRNGLKCSGNPSGNILRHIIDILRT